MAKDDIVEHQWEKGQSGNPKGRPKKSFSSINAQLKQEGIEPLKKSELMDAYAMVFNTSEARLKEIAADKETPYALRIIILELNSSKTRSRAMQDYRDYCFGRARESIDHTTKGKEIAPTVINLGPGVKPEGE